MSIRGKRGTALAVVLSVTALMLIICLSLATIAMLNLNLSNAAVTTAQMTLLAQSAVCQFVSESNAFNAAHLRPPVSGQPNGLAQVQPAWASRFSSSPVFPTGGADLPGTVEITFDTGQPHFSVDNSQSENPAAGANGPVPPFSVSLMMKVSTRGQTRIYEAVLRRLWPYAIVDGSGPISLTGKGTNATHIVGDTYSLLQPPNPGDPNLIPGTTVDRLVDPPSDINTDPMEERLSASLIRSACLSLAVDQGELQKGGVIIGNPILHFPDVVPFPDAVTLKVPVMNPAMPAAPAFVTTITTQGQLALSFPTAQATTLASDGNVLEGNAAFAGHTVKAVTVVDDPSNQFTGREQDNVSISPNAVALINNVPLPDPQAAHFTQVAFQPYVPRPPNLRVISAKAFYRIEHNLVIGPGLSPISGGLPVGDPSPTTWVQSGDTQFVITGSAGNRFFDVTADGTGLVEIDTGAGLSLQNCVLFVDGNLDLSSSQATGSRPALQGDNATLIVNGTLLLNDGSLDATDQGMVIYAKEIISQASGHYQGLMIAQHNAAFYPPTDSTTQLSITGGLLVGGQPVEYSKNFFLNGLTLFSTEVKYDPRFLKILHPFGSLKLLALRLVN